MESASNINEEQASENGRLYKNDYIYMYNS